MLKNIKGFTLIEALAGIIIAAVLGAGTIITVDALKPKAEEVAQQTMDTNKIVAQMLYEDSDVSDKDVSQLTESDIRDIFGDDLDDKRVDIAKGLLNDDIDLEELTEKVKADGGWKLSEAEIEALQEMTGGIYTDEGLQAQFGINAEDYTVEGMASGAGYLNPDHINWDHVEQIIGGEIGAEAAAELVEKYKNGDVEGILDGQDVVTLTQISKIANGDCTEEELSEIVNDLKDKTLENEQETGGIIGFFKNLFK